MHSLPKWKMGWGLSVPKGCALKPRQEGWLMAAPCGGPKEGCREAAEGGVESRLERWPGGESHHPKEINTGRQRPLVAETEG